MSEVLVLGGGGVVGEAWMSAVLAGMQERGFDARGARAYVGTSAGSIVAASLAAGIDPADRLGELPVPDGVAPAQAAAREGLLVAAAAPVAALGLAAMKPLGAVARRIALSRVPHGRRSLEDLRRHIERLGLRWDGRLRVAVVELASGRRVVFGSHGAPDDVPVATAVQASCAIPGYFEPVAANGRLYVDGGAWSPTNMDAAPAGRGDRVLCLNPTGAMLPVSRAAAAAEALALRRRGAEVTIVNPDAATTAAIGGGLGALMDPSRRDAVIAAGHAQGHTLHAA